MQREAKDFVAKRLSPTHLALIVFVVTSFLLQSFAAFADQSHQANANAGANRGKATNLPVDPNTYIKWEPSAPTNFKDALARARRIAEISRGSEELRNAQKNVLKIAETIAQKLTEGQNRVQNDGEITREQRDSVIRYLETMRTWMRTELETARIPLTGVILINPNLGATATNVHQIEVDWLVSKKEELRRQAVAFAKGTPGAIKHFGVQYATFGVAKFLLDVMQLGYAYEINPTSIEQNLRGLFDGPGAAGFAVFMAANHPVAKLLHGIKNKTVPLRLIPYVAMLAGGMASTMFHEVIEDKDLRACSRSYFVSLRRDEAACNKALDTWVVTNKIVDWTPGLVSLVASQAAADFARAGLVAGGKTAYKGLNAVAATRFTIRGLVFVPATAKYAAAALRAFGTAAMSGNPVATFTIGGVQFMAFLWIDSMISEPIRNFATDQLMARLNLKTTFQKYGFHRDFYDPPAGAKQMIQDAFDVEGTDLRSASKYLRLNYINLAHNDWQEPSGPNKCVPPGIAERKMPGILLTKPILPWGNAFDGLWSWARVAWKKSDEQLRCEVLAQPKAIIGRYAEQSEAWRTEYLLKSFKAKQQNWLQLIAQFNEEFQTAMKLTKFFAEAKFATAKDPSKKPDLSPQAIAKASVEDEGLKYLRSEPKPSPIVEQTIRALACGTKQNVFMRGVSKVMDWWHSGPTSAYIPTKFGTSWNFYAPNITTGDGSICRNGAYTSDPDYTPMTNETQINAADTFTGKFYDRTSGKTYTGLAEYIFDNLADEVWNSNDGRYSNFSTYWTTHVQDEVEKVWATYTETYKKLVTEHFVPVAFNREFRNGCPALTPQNSSKGLHDEDGFVKQTTANSNDPNSIRLCPDNHMSLRVAHGAYLAIEIELRNYFRGLHALNAALYKDPMARASSQGQLVKLANDVVTGIATLNPDDLRKTDVDAWTELLRSKVEEMKTLMESRLDELNEPKEKSFRRETVAQLTTLSLGLLTEAANMAGEVKMMDFADANARPIDKDIYKKKGGNPFNRGSQH